MRRIIARGVVSPSIFLTILSFMFFSCGSVEEAVNEDVPPVEEGVTIIDDEGSTVVDDEGVTTQPDCCAAEDIPPVEDDVPPGEIIEVVDNDEDGVPADKDCDDESKEIGAATLWYQDKDDDGYGVQEDNLGKPDGPSGPPNPLETWKKMACEQPEGYVANSDDCNDDDGKIHPGATEHCDGIDNDCDESTKEGGLVTIEKEVLLAGPGGVDGGTSFQQETIETQSDADGVRTEIELGGSGLQLGATNKVLRVCAGIHYVDISVNGSWKILKVDNEPISLATMFSTPQLHGGDKGTVITLNEGADLTIREVLVTGGNGSSEASAYGFDYADVGGGIFCQDANLILQGTWVTNSTANRGGAIFAHNCDVRVRGGAVLKSNSASRYGGAIWYGGGDDDDTLIVRNSTLTENTVGPTTDATARGGAIFARNGKLDIDDSDFTDNEASKGTGANAALGGAVMADTADVTCNSTTDTGFSGNKVNGNTSVGTAIVLKGAGSLTSVGCTFNNSGDDIAGVAECVKGGSSCVGKDLWDEISPEPSTEMVVDTLVVGYNATGDISCVVDEFKHYILSGTGGSTNDWTVETYKCE